MTVTLEIKPLSEPAAKTEAPAAPAEGPTSTTCCPGKGCEYPNCPSGN